jgi:hypothetical protein
LETYSAFREVMDHDARQSIAALQLVLIQPSISSQLVDNLNACVHLRALLTESVSHRRDFEIARRVMSVYLTAMAIFRNGSRTTNLAPGEPSSTQISPP